VCGGPIRSHLQIRVQGGARTMRLALEDGAPGDVLLRAARDAVDRTTTDVPDSEKNAGFGPSR
jgi:hypothetical protein